MKLLNIIENNPVAFTGITIVILFCLAAVLAPVIMPHDPWQHFEPFLSPSGSHLLGTNDIGQDIFSELILASRISLVTGLLVGFLAVSIGVVIGILAGFSRSFIDNALMGLTDIFLVIPALPLIILLAVYLETSIWITIAIIGVIFWPSTARVVRSQVLSLKQSGYVESSRALGAGDAWIMWRHILPNVIPIILAKFVLTVAAAMLIEASLSFIGLGDPTAKSWGMMLHYAFERGGFIRELWWWYVPPGLCLGVCILGLTFISLGVEEKSDPRLRRALDK